MCFMVGLRAKTKRVAPGVVFSLEVLTREGHLTRLLVSTQHVGVLASGDRGLHRGADGGYIILLHSARGVHIVKQSLALSWDLHMSWALMEGRNRSVLVSLTSRAMD